MKGVFDSPNCYIIFDYVWHLSGVKPVYNYFKSFASIEEAGEYLINIFRHDFDEGIFESLLTDEETDEVKAAISKLKQYYVVDKTPDLKVKLDLSCFEFKITSVCIWPDGANEIIKTVIKLFKEYHGEDLEYHALLNKEKFDEVFEYMIENHPYKGVF